MNRASAGGSLSLLPPPSVSPPLPLPEPSSVCARLEQERQGGPETVDSGFDGACYQLPAARNGTMSTGTKFDSISFCGWREGETGSRENKKKKAPRLSVVLWSAAASWGPDTSTAPGQRGLINHFSSHDSLTTALDQAWVTVVVWLYNGCWKVACSDPLLLLHRDVCGQLEVFAAVFLFIMSVSTSCSASLYKYSESVPLQCFQKGFSSSLSDKQHSQRDVDMAYLWNLERSSLNIC